jgi:hypothetical protein
MDVHARLANKELSAENLAKLVIADPELLPQLFEGLKARQTLVKFGCEKVLRIISKKAPLLLYPHFDVFLGNLDNENSFLRWGAIHVLGNLAAVDSKGRFNEIIDKYLAPIPGPALIPAANAITGAARIAVAIPGLTSRITVELLKVEHASYQTPECRNVALGQVIDAFDIFFDRIEDKEAVLAMVNRQLTNTRNANRKRAERFLKRHIP